MSGGQAQTRFSRPKLKHLKQIAIDEISIGKGHRYVTLVMDLESGAVVHVGEGKGGDALANFWKRLRSSGAKVQAVATDMSPAYIEKADTSDNRCSRQARAALCPARSGSGRRRSA